MQPPTSSSPPRILRVEHRDAIAFLIDVQEIQWLMPFMTSERRLAPVAQELAVNLSFLSRKVKRLIKLGLLEVTRSEARKGRAITYYRATADEFFIPEHTGAITAFQDQSDRKLNQQLQHGILEEWMSREDSSTCDWGMRVVPHNGRMMITGAIRPGESWNALASNVLAASYWRHAKLKPGDAEWLKHEIERLSLELEARQSEEGQPFLIRLAFAPKRPE
jgi:predicted transcriptional regulator